MYYVKFKGTYLPIYIHFLLFIVCVDNLKHVYG